MGKISRKKEALELVYSGDYNIVQQVNGGPEAPYEGCEHNLYMILEDSETRVRLLKETDPQAREGCKTYKIDFATFTLIIWENNE